MIKENDLQVGDTLGGFKAESSQKMPQTGYSLPGADVIPRVEEPGKSWVGMIGGVLGIALAVFLVAWPAEGKSPVMMNPNGSDHIMPMKEMVTKDDEKIEPSLSAPQESSGQATTMVTRSQTTEDDTHTLSPDKGVTNEIRQTPILPKTPSILVIVTGDESIAPSARSHLYSKMRHGGARILTFAEIPLLREKMQMGDMPVSWYDIKQITPPGEAQILVLAEINKTGTVPLTYMEREDELTVAAFSLQAVDMETGASIYSSTDTVEFTAINMNQRLKERISSAAQEAEFEIKQYWDKKIKKR